MEEKITYTEAFAQLQQIVKDMEDANVSIDDLAENIKKATELIKICKEKLMQTEEEVNKTMAELS